ncbi:SAM-dependent chlorinase/fluorinase [candidate division WOR-3 bacterium]|nr:SAM-dependent chlorinase/fluorinase [candidate division WOR-3 bacterium]
MRTYKIKQNQIITLITDFGCQDEYVGVMKGVMLAVNPNLTFVDITHSVPPQDIKKAALILYKIFYQFLLKSYHL